MKATILSLMAASLLFFSSCNNDADGDNNKDSATTTGTTDNGGSTTTTTDYAAKADEFDRNSEAGKYMDVRTGKPVKLSMDRTTGRVTNKENNQEVTRYIYVDNNDWWVYDWEGNKLGQAKWENDKVLFDDNGNWVDYDAKWKDEDAKIKMDEDEAKLKTDDTKIKVEKDGDTKIKTDDKKIKKDEDGTKVKDNK